MLDLDVSTEAGACVFPTLSDNLHIARQRQLPHSFADVLARACEPHQASLNTPGV